MSYAYPAPRTGTTQDLMRVITKSYEDKMAREGVVLPAKSEAQRRFLEPVVRAVGIVVAKIMEAVPGDMGLAVHEKMFRVLSGDRTFSFNSGSTAVSGARALAARLKEESGLEPALLAAISHPPVLGELAYLNFELVRHALLTLREVRGRSCRPRLVAAVDPFALDNTAIIEEGLYAGYMGSFHIGLDRLALGRGHLGPALSPQTRWDRMPFRLFRVLAEGGEVGMVLSGGIPTTGLVLYGMREWARRAWCLSPMRCDPVAVLGRLRKDELFARFESAVAPFLALARGPLRVIEIWLMSAAAGLVPGQTAEAAAGSILSSLAVGEAERRRLLEELARERTRETPIRRRLFRLLVGRVARRRPLVLLPIIHGTKTLGVTELGAWGVVRLGPGRVRVIRAETPHASQEMTAVELAERFTTENFA
jgi:hypothetical protein